MDELSVFGAKTHKSMHWAVLLMLSIVLWYEMLGRELWNCFIMDILVFIPEKINTLSRNILGGYFLWKYIHKPAQWEANNFKVF